MKKIIATVLALAIMLTLCVPAYASGAPTVDYEATNQNVVVIDGQAVLTTAMYESTIELSGLTQHVASYDENTLSFDGLTVMETETVQRQDITIQGYTRQSTPALGTERDYTVDQGSRNIDVVFRNTIRSLTSLAIGTFLSAFTGGLLLPLGVALVDVAYSINDDSKTSILTVTCPQYSHSKNVRNCLNAGRIQWGSGCPARNAA